MSSATAKTRALPREISSRLARLRSQLTRWLLVDGISHWLAAVILMLVLDMGLDRLFKMDFAQRSIMLVVMVLFAIVYLFQRVLRPLGNRPGDDALLYEVEAKHAQLKESLLSGAQLARLSNTEELGASPGLTEATIQRGIEQARSIDFGLALNQPRYRNNLIMMGVGVVLLLMLVVGVSQTAFFKTWFNRNILLQDDAWPQGTYLEIMGAEDGQLVLPRGVDHRQLVEVSPDSQIVDVDVTLEIDGPGGKTVHSMKPTGRQDGRDCLLYTSDAADE